jgi:GTPase SAR1 family protein
VPPTFRLVALGPSGCGKSVFLSTLFHELNFPVPGRAYHLEADLEQLTALSSLYDQVCDTSLPWPRATRRNDTREYVFDCVASENDGSTHPIMRVTCLDYSGELVENDDAQIGEAQRDLQSRVASAHALMGMLDGRRVRQLLRGEPDGARYFETTLRPMFSVLQRARCPIHLVLTKWDLVRDYGEGIGTSDSARLARVIDALLQFGHINALVRSREGRQIVRLIPVSSIGPAFADLNSAGHVVKRRDGKLEPTNVDVPLCAVLPDLFEQLQQAQKDASRRDIDREARRRLRNDTAAWFASMGIVMRRPTQLALRWLVPIGPLGGELAALFDSWASTSGRQIIDSHASRTDRAVELMSLRHLVINDFRSGVDRLEHTFPNSRLNPRWAGA